MTISGLPDISIYSHSNQMHHQLQKILGAILIVLIVIRSIPVSLVYKDT